MCVVSRFLFSFVRRKLCHRWCRRHTAVLFLTSVQRSTFNFLTFIWTHFPLWTHLSTQNSKCKCMQFGTQLPHLLFFPFGKDFVAVVAFTERGETEREGEDSQERVTGQELNMQPRQKDRSLWAACSTNWAIWERARHHFWPIGWPVNTDWAFWSGRLT